MKRSLYPYIKQALSEKIPTAKPIQLVLKCSREKTFPNGLEVRELIPWMSKIDFSI